MMQSRGRILGISVLLALVVSAAFAGAARAAEDSDVVLPSISSDKADYAPGETVTLHGSHWAPGEAVHIRVNDDSGQTWSRDVDVVADADGNISDQFALPDWFVAMYSVTASGPVSGSATTSFSDATLVFALATAGTDAPSNVTWSVDWDLWQGQGNNPNLTCNGTRTSFGTAAYSGNTLTSGSGTQPGINQNASAKPTGARTTGTFAGTYVFDYWSTSATSTTPLTNLCRAGVNGPTVFTLFAHFKLADVTPPATTASATLAGGGAYSSGAWTNRDVTVALGAADNAGGSGVKEIRYSINGGAETVVAGSSATVPVSTEGASTISYFAKDNAGNAETARTFAVMIDKTAPTIARNVPADACSVPGSNGWCRGIQTAGFTASDSGSGLANPSQASFTKSSSVEGSAVQIASGSVTDVAGNSNTGINAGPFKIDASAPTVSVIPARPADHGDWYNQAVSFTAAADDHGGSGNVVCDPPETYSGPDSAAASVSMDCSDEAGNSASNSATFEYDATDPVVTLTLERDPDHTGWYNHPVGYAAEATDMTSGTESCDAAASYNGPDGDPVTVSLSCTDNAGNSGSGTTSLKYDATAPAVTVAAERSPDADEWYNHAVAFSASGEDDGGSGNVVCDPDAGYSGPDNADAAVSLSCSDEAGNSGSGSIAFAYDATAPSLNVALARDPDRNGWYNHPVGYGVSNQNDATSGIASCEPDDVYSGPDGNPVTVNLSCTDNAGNSASDSQTLNYDATDPVVTVSLARDPDHNGWYNHPVGYSAEATDATSGTDNCEAAASYNGPDGDPVTVNLSCSDNAGNSASDPQTLKYDATPSNSQAASPEFNNGPTIAVSYASGNAGSDLSGLDSVELWVEIPGGTSFEQAVNTAKTTASGSFEYEVDAGEGAYRFYTVVVDRAGNREAAPADTESSTQVTTTLQDETAPVTSDDAPGGWENSAVTVHLNATDGGSGVRETYYRVDGADVYSVGTSVLVAAPVDHSNDGVHTIDYYSVDKATNVEGVKTATVRIDTTAPALTDLGATPAAPDGNNGWYVHPVSNRFRAADAGSGIDSACLTAFPADTGGDNVQTKTTGGEGIAVKVVSDGCADEAGNTAAAIESAGFDIDMTAPSISLASRLPAPNANGWNNTGVTVTWDCADSLSGPTTAHVSDTKSDEGAGQTAHGTCEDSAGNTASASKDGISIDTTKPVVSGGRAPVANSYGWNKVDVVVSFTCSDVGTTQSEIDVDTVAGTTVSSEGADQAVTNTGDCVDKAGNAAVPTTVGEISIDKSDPTITLASRLPAANANGWNNTDVEVEWSCADQAGLSGVVAAETVDTVSGEGADQSAHGTCEDRAGNSATASRSGISIDKTKPSISIVAPANGQSYKWNVAVAAAYSCSDGLSGLAGCSGDVANGANFVALPVGSKSFNVDSSDRAGNTAAAASSYSVIYDFLGLFQPVDMGANVLNAVKAGSAVPVKFKLGGNAGLDVFQTGSPSSVGITCSASAVIDPLEETVTASTSGLQYDAVAGQYVYVWKTNSAWAGTCRQLKVAFKDGRAVTANFKFK